MTPSTSRLLRRAVPGALVLTFALLAGGCWNPFSPPVAGRGVSEPPPAPNTVPNTLRLLEWCYKNRSFAEYRELFTADYRFVFSTRDTAGNAYSDATPWTRTDELESTRKLFEGGDANQPAATSIVLQLDKNFTIFTDPRPGKNNPLQRKSVTSQVNLTITTTDGASTNVFGSVTFYLVRGDSANIPKDLGLGPDPNRWYIERWDDNTNGAGLSQALGAPGTSLRVNPAARAAPPLATALPRSGIAAASLPRPAVTPAEDLPFYSSWGQVKAWYR